MLFARTTVSRRPRTYLTTNSPRVRSAEYLFPQSGSVGRVENAGPGGLKEGARHTTPLTTHRRPYARSAAEIDDGFEQKVLHTFEVSVCVLKHGETNDPA